MVLFESMLTLVLVAIALLQVSRRFLIPYPTMLALAGVLVSAVPWAPSIVIDPRLALALFIAPALLDGAYDMPPRVLRRNWLPLVSLAAVAVILTTIAVAWVGLWAGLPFASAVALGAIVAPPDAAAATAMLGRFVLPRRTVAVLQGESLLNDSVALLIFDAAVLSSSQHVSLASLLPKAALAVPGGILLGMVLAKIYLFLSARLQETLGGTLFQFASVFGCWILAERLHLSTILCVVAYSMVIARYVPERTSARERVHSYSVWGATVFLLNVLAFLLMGLQAREIVVRLDAGRLWSALGFASLVLLVVVLVRLAWVMLYNRAVNYWSRRHGGPDAPSAGVGLVVSWCGMRGLVTLAAALALPASFPERDLIVLSSLAVVMGTLVGQGLTLGPLIRYLRFEPDRSFETELLSARVLVLEAALASLEQLDDAAAVRLREDCLALRDLAASGRHPQGDTLRRDNIAVRRKKLVELRHAGAIDDDVFHAVEHELDWAELAVLPPEQFELLEG